MRGTHAHNNLLVEIVEEAAVLHKLCHNIKRLLVGANRIQLGVGFLLEGVRQNSTETMCWCGVQCGQTNLQQLGVAQLLHDASLHEELI